MTVLALSGRMTQDGGDGGLRETVRALVHDGRRKLVLNLAGVSYMDSTCIGELVSDVVTVRNSGGAVHLANLTEHIERMMSLAGLLSVVPTFGSEEDAVKGLASSDTGEVYRARDTKLDRDVALKVLPQGFTEDPDRLAKFEREAKVLASLNHPNIGRVYGSEEAGHTLVHPSGVPAFQLRLGFRLIVLEGGLYDCP